MARLPRLTLPGMAHYVIQRGNNLQPIFEDVQDYETMKDLMREMARRFQVDLHAYVLLPAQFHVLATPETEEGLPLFMQSVGRSYVRYFNNRHGRSGTLWEGRYRSTVLEASASPPPATEISRPSRWLKAWWGARRTTYGPVMRTTQACSRTAWCAPMPSTGPWPIPRSPGKPPTSARWSMGCRQPWRKRCWLRPAKAGPWDRRILWRNCSTRPSGA